MSDEGERFGEVRRPREGLAPVIPLFGGAVPDAPRHEEVARPWHASWIDDDADRAAASDAPADRTGSDHTAAGAVDEDDVHGVETDGETERELAERTLLRRLRGRSLSISEARAVVRERDLEAGAVEALLDSFQRLGYLDDVMLAEQLIHSGTERKGQGRRVIAQTMAKRGIPRDVADAVLADLPDDDDERALEFARTKARSMGSLDRDTALRRLTGQLARRGYGGSVAMSAARTALDEVQKHSSSVRFR